jgi:hypothetical protein
MSEAIAKFNERFLPRQRIVLLVLAVSELSLKLAAARDIQRRPTDQVRGSKLPWRLALLINALGPVSYFCRGRRKTQP